MVNTKNANLSIELLVNVYNAEQLIDTFFQSILNQTYSKFSIIVVDDGSTDDTIPKINKYKSKADLKIYKRSHEGLQKARKFGVEQSNADIIIITDVDLILDQNAIKELITPFKENDIGGVGGLLKNTCRNHIEESYGALREIFYYLKSKGNETDWISGGFSAVRKSVIKLVGGYTDTASSEDIDISWKIKKQGYNLILNKKAIAYHGDPTSITEIWKREKHIGIREFTLTQHHFKESLKPRRLLRFYPLTLPLILPLLFFISYQICIVLILSTYLTLILIVNGSIQSKIISWPIFNIMNIAYCLGFLKAAIKK